MTIHRFQLRETPLVAQSWVERLRAANNEKDVVAVTRDFLASYSPDEISRLPEPCRPGKFFDAEDIAEFAFALARHHCADEQPVAALVSKLANFFAEASMRLSQIMARSNNNETESRESA